MEKPIYGESIFQVVERAPNQKINCLFIIDKQFRLVCCIIAEISTIKARFAPFSMMAAGRKTMSILCFVSRRTVLYLSCTFGLRFFPPTLLPALHHSITETYIDMNCACAVNRQFPFYVTLNLKRWVLITLTKNYWGINTGSIWELRADSQENEKIFCLRESGASVNDCYRITRSPYRKSSRLSHSWLACFMDIDETLKLSALSIVASDRNWFLIKVDSWLLMAHEPPCSMRCC